VLESGLLEDHEDHHELSEPLPALAIPTTLHDLLMARLDRLATVPTCERLAERDAVVGPAALKP